MRDRGGAEVFIRQRRHPAGCEVGIPAVERDRVVGGEEVDRLQGAVRLHVESDDRLTEVARRRVSRGRRRRGAAVARAQQDRAGAVGGEPRARLPDAGSAAALIGDPARLHRTCAGNAEHPPLPGSRVAVRAEGGVDDAFHQQQARSLQLGLRFEVLGAAFVDVLGGAFERDREAGLLGPRCHVHRIHQPLRFFFGVAVGLVRDVGDVRFRVDHRRRGHPHIRCQVGTADFPRIPGFAEAAGPQLRSGRRIEPVQVVFLGGHEQGAVVEQGLRVDLPRHRRIPQPAKGPAAEEFGSDRRLVRIPPGAEVAPRVRQLGARRFRGERLPRPCQQQEQGAEDC